MIIIIFFILAV